MRNVHLATFVFVCLVCLLTTACTPPPPKGIPDRETGQSAQGISDTTKGPESETLAGSSGQNATPLGDGSMSEDGTTFTETGEGEGEGGEASGEESGEEEAIDEPMTDKQTDPNHIFAGYATWPPERITAQEVELLKKAVCVLETTKGTIKIRLFPDSAPIHCANFVKLIQDGFYDGLTFHRVIQNFMSQGGDPLGDGTGGPGYTLPAEIRERHEAGSVAGARLGDDVNPRRNSSGSQFYICHSTQGCAHLDGQYTVFGKVIEGQDVNLSLNVTGQGVVPDKIIHAYVEFPE
jgi:cyclophilin family peptidyl-prolyl cis-trans isomerase